MKPTAIAILLPACCLWTLSLPACGLRQGRAAPAPAAAAPKPAPPEPQRPAEVAADFPISVPQTQVTLPRPQPIQAEALTVIKVEAPPTVAPPSQAVKPRPAPRAETRQQAAPMQTTPAGPQPPPPQPASRRRIRPVESAAERGRLMNEISTRQRQVQENLAKARTRQLTDAEKSAVERIQAFLEQTETALKDQDLQQAAALSNRALLLSQDLNSEK